ncbi:prolyl oligopeptidase family serine peptidase [Ornithobacterium rhinotracheale]|uniref:alpha/beta hydrolase family protein n=1 Tax=Ornithobacterium rhinotracheale TaxID=28251 RepID=UPI001FF364A5|nr:prolyl oligopeptidase family serine peptidase [Ornithobacterium rhinotracheale]MCK0201788.1 prolyl oligopeptidase family serine peptidase [Ornithobacterium rhinotracheale]
MKRTFLSLCLLGLVSQGFAQENISYQVPSQAILELADYERVPSVLLNDNRSFMVLANRNTYKTLEELNQDEMRLAGVRFNPNNNISNEITYYTNLQVKDMKTNKVSAVKNLPENAKISSMSFSPDNEKLAFLNIKPKSVELWYVDLKTATAHRLETLPLNAIVGTPYSWLKNSQGFLIKEVSTQRKPYIDKTGQLPSGPIVSTSSGKVSQNRTYQDLLKDPQDEANFENAMLSSLSYIDLNGKKTPFLKDDLYLSDQQSPDGNYWLISVLKKPFSYIVPIGRFPIEERVYDKQGNLVKVVYDKPLDEIRPKGFSSTRVGKRNINWRNDAPATLYFVEALDGGDANKPADYRDEIYFWKAPFNENPTPIFKTKQRFNGIDWVNDRLALVSDSWYDTRNVKQYAIDPSNGNLIKVIQDRNYQDVYSDPGSLYKQKNQWGEYVVATDKGKAYLFGDGYTPKGQFPFVDEIDLKNFKTKRLYTSNLKGKKESLLTFSNFKNKDILTQIESPEDYPNYYVKSLKSKKSRALTEFKNPFEALKGVHKEVIHYKRNDGVDLTGTLYLPKNYDPKSGEKLPLLIWAYPAEYKSKSTAGQNKKNPNEFTYPYYGSFVYWVNKGYAVLDDASFPIIGEGTTEPNDTFIEQLVADGRAAIDAVDKLGYIDRNRVAVGGHSYGAFMTANLLTHSDDFKCGVARSGAYNRTLTPFGFQSEQRNYWDNPKLYNTMSPFMNANKMKKPLLLIHGDADNNSGTFTFQSIRYFQALKNLGAPVRLVLLPKESHGYRAKKSIMHVLWEQEKFLDDCLKK